MRPERQLRVNPAVIGRPEDRILVVHRSKALIDALRRFNCFSNNDIERVGSSIGPASELGRTLDERLGGPTGSIRLQTTSGLGENRLTPPDKSWS